MGEDSPTHAHTDTVAVKDGLSVTSLSVWLPDTQAVNTTQLLQAADGAPWTRRGDKLLNLWGSTILSQLFHATADFTLCENKSLY